MGLSPGTSPLYVGYGSSQSADLRGEPQLPFGLNHTWCRQQRALLTHSATYLTVLIRKVDHFWCCFPYWICSLFGGICRQVRAENLSLTSLPNSRWVLKLGRQTAPHLRALTRQALRQPYDIRMYHYSHVPDTEISTKDEGTSPRSYN